MPFGSRQPSNISLLNILTKYSDRLGVKKIGDLNPSSSLSQRYIFVPARVKDCYLVYLIRTLLSEPTRASSDLPDQIIVFTSTCNTAQLLAECLRLLDVASVPLHSRISQVLFRELASFGFLPKHKLCLNRINGITHCGDSKGGLCVFW